MLNTDSNAHSFDDVENILIHLLEVGDIPSKDKVTSGTRKGDLFEIHAPTLKLSKEVMRPKDAYTFDLSSPETDDDHRLYTCDQELLLRPVWETLGESSEIVFQDSKTSLARWCGLRRIKTLPRGFATIKRPHAIYQLHFREYCKGVTSYTKDIAAFDSMGKNIKVFVVGADNRYFEQTTPYIAASVIEDSRRSNSFLASVHDSVTLRFPVGIGAHLDFFKEREAPLTPSGRRKAILHWVKKHQRKNTDKPIEPHLRGIKELTMDNIKVTLESF